MKQKKQTECIEPSGYKNAKNGRLMHYCKCAECGIMKFKFIKNKTGGSFDEAILETVGRLGKVGLSQAIKSKMAKRATVKMVDKMFDNFFKRN